MGQEVTDMGLAKSEPRKELKKHAATIHCSNSLSLLQRKITNALLYHAYKELMLKEEHEITIKQLCRLIGYYGNNHGAIKEALKELIATVIEWNIVNDETGTENWTASSILASVSLEGPLCYYAYSPRMKQLLHSPSMFGKIDLVIQSKFRSSYGLALYENCIRYRGLPQTKWFEMDIFKKLMGVAPEMYDIFRDFKRRVLDKAVDEVNMYSDLVISPEYQREGRKVSRVRFTLKDRAKKIRLGQNRPVTGALDESLKVKLLNDFGLSIEQIEELLSSYGAEYVADKISIVEAMRPYQEGKVRNRAGYLLSAVKNNYQLPKSHQHEVVQLEEVKAEIELASVKREIESLREDYKQYREQQISDAIDQLEEGTKQTLMMAFMTFAEPTIALVLKLQRNKYTRDNVMESPQVQALLRQFAVRELDTLKVVSLEEFVVTAEEEAISAWQKLKSLNPEHELLKFSE